MTPELFPTAERWQLADRQDQRVRRLADRHYSRQSPGDPQFAPPPGRGLFLIAVDAAAAWVVVENLDPVGNVRWRNTLFRNEGNGLSSDLIREATRRTYAWWDRHYGQRPAAPLTTEVDPERTRRKRDPGRCFLRAGWRHVGWTTKGLRLLEAP